MQNKSKTGKRADVCKNRCGIIVGIDEAGRGPLAGPVMAVAITCFAEGASQADFALQMRALFKITDSKKMTAKQREQVYQFLKKRKDIEWGTGKVGEKVIDRINILQSAKLAMARAVRNLEKKIGSPAELLLIDGNFAIDLPHQQKSIIKGDEKVFLISLASIAAKVERDRAMLNYHKKYPEYQFKKHKGYPTKLHREMLQTYGACKLHRQSYGPIKLLKSAKLLQK